MVGTQTLGRLRAVCGAGATTAVLAANIRGIVHAVIPDTVTAIGLVQVQDHDGTVEYFQTTFQANPQPGEGLTGIAIEFSDGLRVVCAASVAVTVEYVILGTNNPLGTSTPQLD